MPAAVTTDLTPDRLAARTAAAVDAAVAAGRDLGLAVDDAVVLHDLFSVVVHLAPAPVVARVPTVLPQPTDLDAVATRQQAELDVTAWLADRGVPVLAPSPLVARRPVRSRGHSITLWAFADLVPDGEPDYVANADQTADLHVALRDYPGPLTFLSAAEPDGITASLHALAARPDLLPAADRDRAVREWAALAPLVGSQAAFAARFPDVAVQPVHGDSPPANIVAALDGPRFADFELVTLGPVEWDLAGLTPELERAYDRGARRAGIRPLDPDVLAFVGAVGRLRAVATLALVPQLPALRAYLDPAVDAWRALPFAGGVDPAPV